MKATRQMQPQPWIKPRVKELGKTLQGLGHAMGGLDGSRITEIMAGTRRVQPTEVSKMADYLELPYEVVYGRLFGSVPSAVSGDVHRARAAITGQDQDEPRVHIVRDLGGGIVELSANTAELALPVSHVVPKPFNCYVSTDLMSPAYEQGDDLRVNPTLPVARNTDVLLISLQDGGVPIWATLRRLVDYSDTHWIVRQHNPPKQEKLDRKVWHPLRVESVKRRG
jgi:hypothetical protein